VLYFLDVGPGGADPYLQALSNLGITPTVVPQSSTTAPDTYPQFVTQLNAGGWDLVIFQQRFWSDGGIGFGWVTPLVNHINTGGRVIYSTWVRTQIFAQVAPVYAALGATSTGGSNQTVLNQTVAHAIWDGIPNPFTFGLDGGLGVSSIGLQPAGSGQAIGRWANGDAGLIVGNDGRTVFNGFMPYLATTVAARAQIAQNEISFLFGGIQDDDWYRIDALEGQELVFETTTPAPSTLDPRIELYGPGGELIAAGTVLEDGRNERIVFTVPAGGAGSYRIRVMAENGTRGEYFLDPVDASAENPGQVGFSMAPTTMVSEETGTEVQNDVAGLLERGNAGAMENNPPRSEEFVLTALPQSGSLRDNFASSFRQEIGASANPAFTQIAPVAFDETEFEMSQVIDRVFALDSGEETIEEELLALLAGSR
jgi:hypothetical protein